MEDGGCIVGEMRGLDVVLNGKRMCRVGVG